MAKRNPHAPKNALTRTDIKKGMVVIVVHNGGSPERIRITSGPRLRPQVVADSDAPGGLKKVWFYWVNYYSFSLLRSSQNNLTALGVCPDHEGNWAKAYVVLAPPDEG